MQRAAGPPEDRLGFGVGLRQEAREALGGEVAGDQVEEDSKRGAHHSSGVGLNGRLGAQGLFR